MSPCRRTVVDNTALHRMLFRMPDGEYMVLCDIGDLQDPGSKGVTVACDARLYDLFVVRFGGEVRAYLNSCPHTGAPLDWMPGRFLDIERKYIQCATHNALFDWREGTCISGPCAGDRLKGIPVTVEDGQMWLLRKLLCDSEAPGGS